MVKTATLATAALALGGASAHRAGFQPTRPNGFTALSSTRSMKLSFLTRDQALQS